MDSNFIFKAGKYKKQKDYSSFYPSLLNQNYYPQDEDIYKLAEDAAIALGKLDALAHGFHDIDQFIYMFTTKESTSSNRIEGTKTAFDEALLPDIEINPERKDDYQEVQNYINAINQAIIDLDKLPLSMRLLTKAHQNLLCGVRGKHKLPGEIRKSQNWIGGSSLKDAFYIPPHHDDLAELLTDLEKFLHNDALNIPDLIKIGIAHYQFEAIHPFLDGNGRTGRLLIILYLIDKGLLSKPVLQISDFFDKNRNSYYDSLTLVKSQDNLDQWVKFFLVGIKETSDNSSQILKSIFDIKQHYSMKILSMGRRAKNAMKLFDLLFFQPIIEYKAASAKLGLSQPSVNKLFDDFCKLGILKETTGKKKDRLYRFEPYISLF
ncbi:MAG: Fic family protein [Candidatus Melainabacteria bacterium]|jgi:Fic family protein|nr:Fic family protein [Candidatus Melainabacteria bacterium]